VANTLPTAPRVNTAGLPVAPAGAEPYGPPPHLGPPPTYSPPAPPPAYPPAQTPASTDQEAPRGKRWRGPRRDAGQRSPWSGRRIVVLLARIAVLGVLAVLLLAGLRSVIAPASSISEARVEQLITTLTGENGFPEVAGEHAATLFADAYLTYPADPRQREAALSALAPDVRIQEQQGPSNITQDVIRGPFVIGDAELDGTDRATFTFAAEVETTIATETEGKNGPKINTESDTRWEFLAVPVYADTDTGAVSIAGPPAYVPTPPVADLPAEVSLGANDTEFLSELRNDVLAPFFTDWAASDATRLQLVLDPDATTRARAGLNGAVAFEGLGSTYTPVVDPDSAAARDRYVEVDVQWRTPNGALTTQRYLVNVYRDDAGEWRVWDVETANPRR